jgi:hypothetical protein
VFGQVAGRFRHRDNMGTVFRRGKGGRFAPAARVHR